MLSNLFESSFGDYNEFVIKLKPVYKSRLPNWELYFLKVQWISSLTMYIIFLFAKSAYLNEISRYNTVYCCIPETYSNKFSNLIFYWWLMLEVLVILFVVFNSLFYEIIQLSVFFFVYLCIFGKHVHIFLWKQSVKTFGDCLFLMGSKIKKMGETNKT